MRCAPPATHQGQGPDALSKKCQRILLWTDAMTEYRRNFRPGACYFFTHVTFERRAWLCTDWARAALRSAIVEIRLKRPFVIEAWVLLPDHLHCLWRLPCDDLDFSTRWRLIKTFVTKQRDQASELSAPSKSRKSRREQTLWQRRFWEHTIRNSEDFDRHVDYIHFNPVKHGLVGRVRDWPFSSFHRFVRHGLIPEDWAGDLSRDHAGFGERRL